MNKKKLKTLTEEERRVLYVKYVMLFNDFYHKKSRNFSEERIVFRHYQQVKTRFKRLKSVMKKEEIEKITFTAG